jgi:hypothetical protein
VLPPMANRWVNISTAHVSTSERFSINQVFVTNNDHFNVRWRLQWKKLVKSDSTKNVTLLKKRKRRCLPARECLIVSFSMPSKFTFNSHLQNTALYKYRCLLPLKLFRSSFESQFLPLTADGRIDSLFLF